MSKTPDIDDINALLPQTQCQDCEYKDCKDYATAIIESGESIDKCLPGGTIVLHKIAKLLHQDPTPLIDDLAERQKPALIAVIDEESCIGCTKCIPVCPVDAIIGAPKHMHTVITDACTGCNLCLAPCPVDCIDLVPIPSRSTNDILSMAPQSKQRYEHHQQQKQRQQERKQQKHQQAKLKNIQPHNTKKARQQAILEALARTKKIKDNKS